MHRKIKKIKNVVCARGRWLGTLTKFECRRGHWHIFITFKRTTCKISNRGRWQNFWGRWQILLVRSVRHAQVKKNKIVVLIGLEGKMLINNWKPDERGLIGFIFIVLCVKKKKYEPVFHVSPWCKQCGHMRFSIQWLLCPCTTPPPLD